GDQGVEEEAAAGLRREVPGRGPAAGEADELLGSFIDVGESVEACADCRPWSMRLTIQVKLSSTSTSIMNPPVTSRVANPCTMLRSIRSAWISWLGATRSPPGPAERKPSSWLLAWMSGSSGPVGRAALPAA